MKSIQQQLQEISKRSIQKAEQVVRATCLEISNRTVIRTPVDDGILIASWLMGINAPDSSVASSPDKSGAATIGKISAKINGYSLGDEIYMTNSMPYAYRIEYEGWSSEKRPEGMLRISVAEFDATAERMIRQFA